MATTPNLLMIPSAYKEGKLYSILPNDGSGDMIVDRASKGTRIDSNGLIEEMGDNVPRLDYNGSECPKLLLEPQRTNLLTYSEDYTQWSNNGSVVVNGYNLEDNDTISFGSVDTYIDVPNDTLSRTISYYIEKDNDTTRYPEFYMRYWGGNQIQIAIHLNTKTGATTTRIGESNGSYKVVDMGKYWRLDVTLTNNGSGNIRLYSYVRPAFTNVLGQASYTTGSINLRGVQVEVGNYATSYIPTNGSTVTRLEDNIENTDLYTNGITGDDWTVMVDTTKLTNVLNQQIYLVFNNDFYIYDWNYSDYRFWDVTNGKAITTTKVLKKFVVRYYNNVLSIFIDGVKITDHTTTINFLPLQELEARGTKANKTKILSIYNVGLSDSECIGLSDYDTYEEAAEELGYTID